MPQTFEFQPKIEYTELGYCFSITDNFCTFLHSLPCTAGIAETMLYNGWELYTQPERYDFLHWNRGNKTWIATYRKIVKVREEPNKNARSIPVKVD